jgi:hypothetical protein
MHFPILLFCGTLVLASCGTSENPSTAAEIVSENSVAVEKDTLWHTIMEKDSMLFQLGFNKVDTSVMAPLVDEDLEFYHDEHGTTYGKQDFLQSIVAIGALPFRTERKLVKQSVTVHPLYSENHSKLYGAIQSGTHEFYQQEANKAPRKSATALFTHLWLLEEGDWKLTRVLSYAHQAAE